MREIQFRGKRLDNGEWAFGNLVYADSDNSAVIINADDTIDIDPDTVGQYTGLTDKNCVKIFEGDITTGLFLFGMSVNGIVDFRDGSFGVLWKRGDIDEFVPFTSTCNITFEVIGDIHDNPEMVGED